MMKLTLTAIAIFFTLSYAAAQTNKYESKLGLGLDFAIPTGNYKNTADYGVGISLLYQKPVTENLNITGNVGYLRFNGPGIFNNIKYKEGFVPIKAGARYYIGQYIYGTAEVGITLSTANGYGSGTAFIYAPGLGAEFRVSNSGSVDIGLRYESWARSVGSKSFGGIRAGYNF